MIYCRLPRVITSSDTLESANHLHHHIADNGGCLFLDIQIYSIEHRVSMYMYNTELNDLKTNICLRKSLWYNTDFNVIEKLVEHGIHCAMLLYR